VSLEIVCCHVPPADRNAEVLRARPFNVPSENASCQLDNLCPLCQRVLGAGAHWPIHHFQDGDHDTLDACDTHHTWPALSSSASKCHLCALILESITYAILTADDDLQDPLPDFPNFCLKQSTTNEESALQQYQLHIRPCQLETSDDRDEPLSGLLSFLIEDTGTDVSQD
jgi:hypothetical protein